MPMSEEIDALTKAKVPRNYLHSRSLAAKVGKIMMIDCSTL